MTICLGLLAVAAPDATPIAIPGGKMVVPAGWERVEPKSRIIEHEFMVPGASVEAPAGRVTMMSAGGDIEQNVERWIGQFEPAAGSDKPVEAVREEFDVSGLKIYFVELKGTFKESMGGGPFAPGKVVPRENYQMLGAIIVDEKGGKYFLKLTGPQDVVGGQREAFLEMLKGIQSP
jgi:hypothetical protein